MEKEVVLELPIPNVAVLNANRPINFRVKAFKVNALRTLAYEMATKLNFPEYKRCSVKVVVFPPSKRRVDPPNFYPSVKPIIDGMTDANVWEDDDWKHVEAMTFVHGGDISHIKQMYILKFIIKGEVVE